MPQQVRLGWAAEADGVIPAAQMAAGHTYIVVRGDDVFPAGRIVIRACGEVATIGGQYPGHAGWAHWQSLKERQITVRRPQPGERIVITTEG